jgi:hypothetical protein
MYMNDFYIFNEFERFLGRSNLKAYSVMYTSHWLTRGPGHEKQPAFPRSATEHVFFASLRILPVEDRATAIRHHSPFLRPWWDLVRQTYALGGKTDYRPRVGAVSFQSPIPAHILDRKMMGGKS